MQDDHGDDAADIDDSTDLIEAAKQEGGGISTTFSTPLSQRAAKLATGAISSGLPVIFDEGRNMALVARTTQRFATYGFVQVHVAK